MSGFIVIHISESCLRNGWDQGVPRPRADAVGLFYPDTIHALKRFDGVNRVRLQASKQENGPVFPRISVSSTSYSSVRFSSVIWSFSSR